MTLTELLAIIFPPGQSNRPTPEQEAILRHITDMFESEFPAHTTSAGSKPVISRSRLNSGNKCREFAQFLGKELSIPPRIGGDLVVGQREGSLLRDHMALPGCEGVLRRLKRRQPLEVPASVPPPRFRPSCCAQSWATGPIGIHLANILRGQEVAVRVVSRSEANLSPLVRHRRMRRVTRFGFGIF
jgi:hypothetical protein